MHTKKIKFSTEKILVFLILFFFLVIGFLLFLVFQPMSFLSAITTTKQQLNESTREILISSKPKTFKNDSKTKWLTVDLPNNKLHVLSAIQMNADLSVTFNSDAPSNSSSGLIFYNGLPEKNPDVRKISFFYLLKNKQWILRYQAGKTVKFYGILKAEPQDASGNFSLLISSDGKRVMVTMPDKKTKILNLPNTLYDISNQMSVHPLLGPQSQATFVSLSYEKVKL